MFLSTRHCVYHVWMKDSHWPLLEDRGSGERFSLAIAGGGSGERFSLAIAEGGSGLSGAKRKSQHVY